MSQNENNPSSTPSQNLVPWSTKAKYIGTGIVIGLVISPWVRRTLGKIQPKADELIDILTGKTEEFAEHASDLLARAKEHFHTTTDEKIPPNGVYDQVQKE